ncbi:hypothetical protein J7E88_27470 [Streptomyces sp. ISL-10]|nr:hypothetical protein [Streptomyces sp. ISL-10]
MRSPRSRSDGPGVPVPRSWCDALVRQAPPPVGAGRVPERNAHELRHRCSRPGRRRGHTITPPAPVVDTNGAGDAVASGFLFGWPAGEPPHRCGLHGAVAGAYACTVPSTQTDSVSRDELLLLVAELESTTSTPRSVHVGAVEGLA